MRIVARLDGTLVVSQNSGYIGGVSGLYWDNGKDNGSYYLVFRVQG